MKHSNAVSNMIRWEAKLASAIEKRKQLPPGIAKADAIENEMHCQEKYSEWVRKAQEEQAQKGREELVTEDTKAHWNIWGGWSGNHDRRIEDATCSNCGYRHETVFGSTKKLAKNCPGCNRIMSVCETWLTRNSQTIRRERRKP